MVLTTESLVDLPELAAPAAPMIQVWECINLNNKTQIANAVCVFCIMC